MVITLKQNWEIRSRTRTKEFAHAVQYLLDTFPPQNWELKFLNVLFVRGNYVSLSANADYYSALGMPHLDSNIRVAYGKDGLWLKDRVFKYLFHEYMHLLQDDRGDLYSDKACCQEADAWAEEQVPIYLQLLQNKLPHLQ